MILEQETFDAYGYYPSKLTHGTRKPILAACDECGKIRKIRNRGYRNLCPSCAHKGKNNPNYHITMSEEQKAKIGTAQKGEKNHNWLGGISFEPYCTKFNEEYKDYIRNFFGNICFLCGKTTKENCKALCVHHVNYNKQCGCDGTKCFCVPLCLSCHSKTNSDRDFWQALITEMLKPIEVWE